METNKNLLSMSSSLAAAVLCRGPWRHFLAWGLLAVVLAGCASVPPGPSDPFGIPAEKENFHVFLLMGQSNMAGPAFFEIQADPKDLEPVPHVLIMGGMGTVGNASPADEKNDPVGWRHGRHPLHFWRNSGTFGLGMDFAREYLEAHPGITVGLVPCAWGGAAIDQLNKGTPVYANAMMRVAEARQAGVVKGMVWQQGESDTVTPELADAYEKKLRRLIQDLREDCGNPELAVTVGNLAEFYGVSPSHSGRIERINQVRGSLYRVGTQTPLAAFVSTAGLQSRDGNYVHFDYGSYIELGVRHGRAMSGLVDSCGRRTGEGLNSR